MESNVYQKNIAGIQYLRGLAALGVVFCHFSLILKSSPIFVDLFKYGTLGVHIFFFISGYIIVFSLLKNDYQSKDFFRFLLKRSIRIEPVYIVTILFNPI